MKKDGIEDFLRAVESKDAKALRNLISNNFDIDAPIRFGNLMEPALLHYAYGGNIGAVQFLLENGANPDVTRDGLSALNSAGAVGREDIALLLLQYNANPNTFHNNPTYMNAPLHEFTERGSVEVVTELLARGASTTQLNHAGLNAFNIACMEGNVDIVRLLMNGDDIFGNKGVKTLSSFRYCNPDLYQELYNLYYQQKGKLLKGEEPSYNLRSNKHTKDDEDDDGFSGGLDGVGGSYSSKILKTTHSYTQGGKSSGSSSDANKGSSVGKSSTSHASNYEYSVFDANLPSSFAVFAEGSIAQFDFEEFDIPFMGLDFPALF